MYPFKHGRPEEVLLWPLPQTSIHIAGHP